MHQLPPLAGGLTAGRDKPAFPIPLPTPLAQPITELRVTAFRDYLACPYRFYLRHVLKLQTIGDLAEELDGAAFGDLLHEVLGRVRSGPRRDSSDPDEIRRALVRGARPAGRQRYGRRPLSSVCVQMEQLRTGLAAFADEQAARVSGGWRMEQTEVPQSGERAPFRSMANLLSARPDRPHRRASRHRGRIVDYKSSDSGETSEQVHQRSGGLDRPAAAAVSPPSARSLGLPEPVKLGYVLLPKDASRIQFVKPPGRRTTWRRPTRRREMSFATCCREILAARPAPAGLLRDFASLCQDRVFERDDASSRH